MLRIGPSVNLTCFTLFALVVAATPASGYNRFEVSIPFTLVDHHAANGLARVVCTMAA